MQISSDLAHPVRRAPRRAWPPFWLSDGPCLLSPRGSMVPRVTAHSPTAFWGHCPQLAVFFSQKKIHLWILDSHYLSGCPGFSLHCLYADLTSVNDKAVSDTSPLTRSFIPFVKYGELEFKLSFCMKHNLVISCETHGHTSTTYKGTFRLLTQNRTHWPFGTAVLRPWCRPAM